MAAQYVPNFPTTPIDSDVDALKYHNGVLYVGGDFLFLGGQGRLGIAAVDPVTKQVLPQFNITTSGPTTSLQVRCFLVLNDILYVGFGHAGLVNGSARNGAAAFDLNGNLLPWNPNLNSSVETMTTDGTDIYLGGYFTTVNGGTPRGFVAKVDAVAGTVDPLWNPDFNGPVISMDYSSSTGYVYATGFFTNTMFAPRNYAANISTVGIGVIGSWGPELDAPGQAVRVDGTKVYLGGFFFQVNLPTPILSPFVAMFDDVFGVLDPSFSPSVDSPVLTIAKDSVNNRLALGGYFSSVNGVIRDKVAFLSLPSYALASTMANFESAVRSIEFYPDGFFVGGDFDLFEGNIVLGNGSSTSNFNLFATKIIQKSGGIINWFPWADGQITDVVYHNGAIYIVGTFNIAGGRNGSFARHNIAAFDEQGNVLPWAPVVDSVNLLGVAADNGLIYFVGTFSTVNGQPRRNMAVVDELGVLQPFDAGFIAEGTSTPETVKIFGSSVYVAGDFTTVNTSVPRLALAKFDLAGVVDPGWDAGMSGSVRSMTSDGTLLYVGGNFATTNFGAFARNNMAAFPLVGPATDAGWIGGVSAAFTPAVLEMEYENGFIFAVGDFNTLYGANGTFPYPAGAFYAQFDQAGNVILGQVIPNTNVLALAVHDGFSYAGGSPFYWNTPIVPGVTPRRYYLVAADQAGAFNETYKPNPSSVVYQAAYGNENIWYASNSKFVGCVEGSSLAAFTESSTVGIPRKPVINFYLRKDGQTALKWNQVYMDLAFNRIAVDAYRIYRSTNENLETYELIKEIVTRDVHDVVDTMFNEFIEGFFAYRVTAVLGVNESEPAEAKAVNSPFGSDFI